MVFGACGAPFEVRLHSGDGRGVAACMFELDVPVELLEALFAGEFGAGRAEQPADQIGESPRVGVAHGVRTSCR